MESKFADPPCHESKFGEESKACDQGESKFAECDEDQGVLTNAHSVFGKDPIIGKLIDFWGQSLSNDIQTFFADNCHIFDPGTWLYFCGGSVWCEHGVFGWVVACADHTYYIYIYIDRTVGHKMSLSTNLFTQKSTKSTRKSWKGI
jgi:hypothetical protein